MNKYMNLNRIEFLVTLECSGKCKHCSIAGKLHTAAQKHIDAEKAVEVIAKLSKLFSIQSVMTFGGEPLLYHDATSQIHSMAQNCGIPKRQLITNGYFNKDKAKISEVANKLYNAGVNSLLLSVDYFHQETIPLEFVALFAKEVLRVGIEDFKLHPSWVVSQNLDNPYNARTHEIIAELSQLNIPCSTGNIISPAGNAAIFLKEYFDKTKISFPRTCADMPYSEPLDNIQTISIDPDGNVAVCSGFSIGNIYNEDIEAIISRYNPYEHEHMRIILQDGIDGFIGYAKNYGININKSDYFSICDICVDIRKKLV